MKLPIAKPGTSTENKTGSWRTFKPEVDAAKCKKCGVCYEFCPEGVMGEKFKLPEIDFDYCKGCGICANVCPFKAISMAKEE